MFEDDQRKNMTFHTNFVHRTLSKLQKLKTTDIVQATSGYSFVIYCIFFFIPHNFILMLLLPNPNNQCDEMHHQ